MELRCRGLLFDLDGTLIDSLHAVDRAWTTWALRHGLAPSHVLPLIHGRRSIESIRAILPEVDAEAEDLVLRQIESSDTHGVRALPGAPEFLAALPAGRWGLVTSGTSDVARARLLAAGIPVPTACVFGEDVSYGKPHPEPYLLGAKHLDVKRQAAVLLGGMQVQDKSVVIALGFATKDKDEGMKAFLEKRPPNFTRQ